MIIIRWKITVVVLPQAYEIYCQLHHSIGFLQTRFESACTNCFNSRLFDHTTYIVTERGDVLGTLQAEAPQNFQEKKNGGISHICLQSLCINGGQSSPFQPLKIIVAPWKLVLLKITQTFPHT